MTSTYWRRQFHGKKNFASFSQYSLILGLDEFGSNWDTITIIGSGKDVEPIYPIVKEIYERVKESYNVKW